jgi:hypothetical protein
MSGRCSCCNEILDDIEMRAKDPDTGKYTNMCFACTAVYYEEINDPIIRDDCVGPFYQEGRAGTHNNG